MRPSKQSINAAIAIVVGYLLIGAVEASAMRPSANDNKQLRQLCNQTTSTRLPNGTYRANPKAANRCYAQAIDKLQPSSVTVEGGRVYKNYKTSEPKRRVTKATYKTKMVMVNGVYTSVTVVEREQSFEHQRRVIID